MNLSNVILFVSILILLYIMFAPININEKFIDGIKLIVTKDDAINHLSTFDKNNIGNLNLSIEDATNLFEKLFDETDNDVLISKIFNDLSYLSKNNGPSVNNPFYNKTYLALCDIINNRGIYNNLPWFGNNALTVINLKAMTKERVKYIYNFTDVKTVNFVNEFNNLSQNFYLSSDIVDILKYNKFYTTINKIIKRHPVLNVYESKLYQLFGDIGNKTKRELIMLNIDVDQILNNLTPNQGDENFINLIKQCIKNTLFTEYENNLTITQLFELPQFNHDKNNYIKALVKIMNDLTLFITPNYDYIDVVNTDNLLNSTIGRLNDTILNIRFNRDLNYIRNHLFVTDNDGKKISVMQDVSMVDVMNILYRYYINIQADSQYSLSVLISGIKNDDIKFPSNDDRLAYIINNINDIMLDQILTYDEKNSIIKHEHVDDLVNIIQTLIKMNNENIPYDIIKKHVDRYTKISVLSDMLFYGIY